MKRYVRSSIGHSIEQELGANLYATLLNGINRRVVNRLLDIVRYPGDAENLSEYYTPQGMWRSLIDPKDDTTFSDAEYDSGLVTALERLSTAAKSQILDDIRAEYTAALTDSRYTAEEKNWIQQWIDDVSRIGQW